MAGTYTLTITQGAYSDDASTDATVNTQPTATASGTSTVCVGGIIQLVGGPADMNSYSWTGPNGFNSTEQSPFIPNATFAMSGTYTLTVTNNCGSDDASIYVSVVDCGGGGGGGGGGGSIEPGSPDVSPCSYTLTVNMLGRITKAKMTEDGVLCEDCIALDPPKQNSWEAKAGTKLTLEDNDVPELIKVTLASSSPPSDAEETIGPTYELNAYASMDSLVPSAISIYPLFSMSSAYDPNKLPENTSAVTLAYYPAPNQGWLFMGAEGIIAEVGKARGTLDYFAPATLVVKLGETTLANFIVSNLTISPSQVQPNQEVAISVNVANTGGTSGYYTVELKIDGITEETQQVALAAGASQTVNFTITGNSAGEYTVEISDLQGEFVVVGPSGTNWWPIISLIVILLLAILAFVVWKQLSERNKTAATPTGKSSK